MQKGTFKNVRKRVENARQIGKKKGKGTFLSTACWANGTLALLNVGCLAAYEHACEMITPVRQITGV
jgi:hypothetical protein